MLTTHRDESIGVYRLSGVVCHKHGTAIELFGSRGSLVYDLQNDSIRAGRAGKAMQAVSIPDDRRGGWRAEAEFVAAIREGTPVTRLDFTTAARTMQFTEAVARSSRDQCPVDLPLREFSNADSG